MSEIEQVLGASFEKFRRDFVRQEAEQLQLLGKTLQMKLDTSRQKKTSDATSAAGRNGAAASPRRSSTKET